MSSDRDMIFKLDDYMTPQILTGADAWIHNIMDIIFIEKGTYSDTPDLGVELKSLNYMTADEMVRFLQNEIKNQSETYLPSIPLDDILVAVKEENNGQVTLIITLGFTTSKGKITRSVFVSVKDDIIDYIVDKFDNAGNI